MYLIKLPKNRKFDDDLVVAEWYVGQGEKVKIGQKLCLLESAHENLVLQSSICGNVLKILAEAGQIIYHSESVAIVGNTEEDISQVTEQINAKTHISQTDNHQKDNILGGRRIMETSKPVNVIPVLMPQAGQTMEEGTIIAWKIKKGDRIEVGQVIMEIETDKANMDVEAVDAGRVAKIVAKEGDIVEVKMPIAYLAENDEDVDAYLSLQSSGVKESTQDKVVSAKKESDALQQAVAPARSQSGQIKVSPAARKLAEEKGIDLSTIQAGSGPGGRIISSDLKSAGTDTTGYKSIKLSKMRKAIAQNLLYSKQNIPHFYSKCTVDSEKLFAFYLKTKEQFKCTINDFITIACTKAIRRYPAFRSQYREDEIIEYPSVNIGIAVGTEEGLMVPVILNADQMSFKELSEKARQIIENARNGKLENVGQGIFTVTNLGMFGIEEFSAIINPPESALLSVGAIRDGVTVKDGVVVPTKLMTMILSSDHRVIDGVVAAQFMQSLKEMLESPEQLLQ
ncbi:MAG: 2-oxo acid dehydrogenase subunit E2 [Sedimentisphaerales bacterium]|nr:2-oxo acid dehydrogenase subunit E2 [Sedimentisphaerales bacterium]